MTTELYILLKVKSRKGLGFFEWLWLKLHKEPSRNKSDDILDRLWMGKFIEEEPWEIDEQGCELIPSLPRKMFYLTEKGKKKLRVEKGKYPMNLICRYSLLLIKGLFYVISIAASLYGLIELYEWCTKSL
jgi:hypothetical protein